MNIQQQMPQYNSGSQWHDSTNIGYKPTLPNGIGGGNPSQWNMPSGQNAFGGAQGGQTDIMKNPLVQKQLSGWDAANAANVGRWNNASGYLKGFATPYDPATISRLQSANNTFAKGGADNAFRSEQSLLSQGGQGDASSMAAARDEANRVGTGAAVMANSNLANQAQLANNSAGLQVGQSILSNLPTERPSDYSGLLALQQQQNWMQQQQQNGMPTPISPGQTNGRQSVGGKGPQQDQGFGFGQMPKAPPTSQQNQEEPSEWDKYLAMGGGQWA